jgi:hypothetical protein
MAFPRWPRRRRRCAHWRGGSQRGEEPGLGLTAAAGRGEAIGVVKLDRGGAEVRARQRTEAYRRRGERRRGSYGGGPATGSGLGASVERGENFLGGCGGVGRIGVGCPR